MKPIHLFIFILFVLVAPVVTAAPPPRTGAPQDVVASVNGEPIYREALVKRLIHYYGARDLERMIDQVLIRQAAEREKISITEKEVETELNALRQSPAFRERIRILELAEEQIADDVREALLASKIVAKRQPIGDGDLEQVRARMILVSTESEAQEILRALKQGTDFTQLAREKSLDRLTGQTLGGSLLPRMPTGDPIVPRGPDRSSLRVTRSDYPELWPALAALKPGEVSSPVKVGTGFAILKLEERVSASSLTARERSYLQSRVVGHRTKALRDALRQEAKVLYLVPLSVDLGATQAGSTGGAARVSPQSDVAASVNGEPVTREALVKRLLAYYGARSLDRMINRVLVRQAAERARVVVTEKEVDDQVNQIRSMERTPQRFQQFLAESGLTEALYREEWRYTLLNRKLVEKSEPVRESDLEQVRSRIILVMTEPEAHELIRALRQGGDFIQLAREKSIDKQSGQMGGAMPDFMQADYPDLWQAVASLKPGEVSRPVKLGANYAVLKLEARIPASSLNPQQRDRLRQRLLDYRMSVWLEDLRKRAKISYPVPLAAPPATGDR